MDKSETVTLTLTAVPTELRTKAVGDGGEIEEMGVVGATNVVINGNIWSLHMYNGKVTLQRWTKSCKPKAKAPKKDI